MLSQHTLRFIVVKYFGKLVRANKKNKICYGIYTSKASQKISTSKQFVTKLNANHNFSKRILFKNQEYKKLYHSTFSTTLFFQ